MNQPRHSLLPIATGQQGQHTKDHPEPLANRRGAALQLDEFNLFVGRFLVVLGIIGNLFEIGTSTKAMLIRFAQNPGLTDPGFWGKFFISLFIGCVFQAAMWTLVVNLNDSWISIFNGHPEQAFVTKGEVNLHLLVLMIFEWGGAAINGICDVVFLGSITTDPFLISIGTAALILSSLLMWPLGWKIARNAKRRRLAARQLAHQLYQSQEAARAQGATRVTPVTVEGRLIKHSQDR